MRIRPVAGQLLAQLGRHRPGRKAPAAPKAGRVLHGDQAGAVQAAGFQALQKTLHQRLRQAAATGHGVHRQVVQIQAIGARGQHAISGVQQRGRLGPPRQGKQVSGQPAGALMRGNPAVRWRSLQFGGQGGPRLRLQFGETSGLDVQHLRQVGRLHGADQESRGQHGTTTENSAAQEDGGAERKTAYCRRSDEGRLGRASGRQLDLHEPDRGARSAAFNLIIWCCPQRLALMMEAHAWRPPLRSTQLSLARSPATSSSPWW